MVGAVEVGTIAHSEVMPEVLITRGDRFLLVRGEERGRTFWWPPGSYWIEAGVCDLTTTEPAEWIMTTLQNQVGVAVTDVALRGVSIVDPGHAPVLTYSVEIEGEPRPNEDLGFDRAEFFEADRLPETLGRDDVHGRWLKQLISSEVAR